MAKYPAEEFRNLVVTVPEFASALIRRMAEIIRGSDEQIINLSVLTASQRVCLQLLRLAEPDPVSSGSWLVYPLPTQAVLAGDAGTTRETVARVFGRLTEKGLIHRKGRSLYIHDRQTLENMAVREASENLLAGKT
jgi:CRP-like cAMP-binding protein